MGHVAYGAELAGVPAERVFAMADETKWDEKRRAVFAFASAMSASPPRVSREHVDALRAQGLSDRQVVELAYAVCRYDTMNRLAEAFGTPLERENLWRKKDPSPAPPPPEMRSVRGLTPN